MTIKLRKLRLPFNGDLPMTFPFGATPESWEIRKKYREWGILGHNGVDFGLPVGTKVLACDGGEIVQSAELGDFGIVVTIKHRWGESLCAHLQEAKVKAGDRVRQGAVIGLSGQSGFALGPHLHFGIKPKKENSNNGFAGFIDPTPHLSKNSTSTSLQGLSLRS